MSFASQLSGRRFQLHALAPHHREGLLSAADDAQLWEVVKPPSAPLGPFLESYMDMMSVQHASGDPFAYVVVDTDTDRIVGSSRYYDVSEADKRLCIGFTWYHRDYWGSGINPPVKYAMLAQVFETWGWHRVAFHVDARNQRSRSAMAYLGAHQEGILRQHKIVQGDFVRDTVLFAITREDWPRVKLGLLSRI